MSKVLVLFSGGLDSTTLLFDAIDKYGKENVSALSLYYGQRHEKEQQCARELCRDYDIPRYVLDLTTVFQFSKSSMLAAGKELTHGLSYAEQKEANEGIDDNGNIDSYVPFRNGLFLSTATAVAYSIGARAVIYGAHADDGAGEAYPDCTSTFVDCMDSAIRYGTGGSVRVLAPFIEKHKKDIVARGLELEVPFHRTWSCYEGKEWPCHTCATCVDREKAFEENGRIDPYVNAERLYNELK